MPRFDFLCKKCGMTFEESIPFGSEKKPACPACASRSTEKLITPPLGIHFKGSGWYKTDSHQAPPKKESAKKEEKDKTKKDTKKETKECTA